jgi:hypothetical protein
MVARLLDSGRRGSRLESHTKRAGALVNRGARRVDTGRPRSPPPRPGTRRRGIVDGVGNLNWSVILSELRSSSVAGILERLTYPLEHLLDLTRTVYPEEDSALTVDVQQRSGLFSVEQLAGSDGLFIVIKASLDLSSVE